MASPDIRFFSPQDNQPNAAQSKPAGTAAPGGYISPAGKLVFSTKTMQRLGIEAAQVYFRVGVRAGKRRIDQLYLLAATDATADAFTLQPGAKGRFINLATQLRGIGLDYARVKYRFTVQLIEVGQQPALALTLIVSSPKQVVSVSPRPPYMGKTRGRKKKALIQQAPVS